MEVGESLFLPKVAAEPDEINVLESTFGSSEQRGEDDSMLRERDAAFRAVQSETEAVLSSTPYWRRLIDAMVVGLVKQVAGTLLDNCAIRKRPAPSRLLPPCPCTWDR